MSDIPIFSAQGKTDSEKLAELIKFMPSLSSAIERQVSSLDFNNLNESLRNRIENSITEHQDLSGFSTNAYTNRRYNEAISHVNTTCYNLEQDLATYINNQDSYLEGRINNLASDLSSLETTASNLSTQLYKLNQRVVALENKG